MKANGLREPASTIRENEPFLSKLLVATDGGTDGDRAVAFAVSLAVGLGSEITFCYSIDRADAIAPAPGGELDAERIVDRARKTAADSGILATVTLLEGDPTNAILECVREHASDAVVVGSQRRHWAERMFRGSATDGVLRRSDVPVFVVPPGPDETLFAKRLLVAIDDSEPSDAALAFGVALAVAESASIVLCTISEAAAIVDKAEYYGTELDATLTELHAAANDLVVRAADVARARGIPCERAIESGDPAEQILRLALTHQAGLIAIGTHGRRGLRRFFLGSVAERVVRLSNVPVSVVRG